MGYALAAEAARRGADVTLVAANVTLAAPAGVRLLAVGTAAELAQACEREFDASDVLLMTAAVADFRPASPVAHKLKKDQGTPTIELEPTDDVLSGLAARRRPGQVLIGFAAEHGAGAVEYGRGKLERKRLDAVVVNDISTPGIGFDCTDNEVTILTAGGARRRVPRASKESVARAVLDEVERLRSRGRKRMEPEQTPVAPQESEESAAVARRLADNVARAVQVRRRDARPPGRRAAGRGPRARRGLPGRRQDRARPRARALDRLPVRAHPVHLGPAAGRRRRHQRLRPARAALRVPSRAGVRERRARRRDQPRLAEDAVGPARVHAGAARDRRRPHARARAPVPRARDAEPDRVRGHLSAARGAGRPVHDPAVARLPGAERRGEDARRPRGRRPRAVAGAGRDRGRGARRPGRGGSRAGIAGAARLRRATAVAHARRPARRARREPAVPDCCCSARPRRTR